MLARTIGRITHSHTHIRYSHGSASPPTGDPYHYEPTTQVVSEARAEPVEIKVATPTNTGERPTTGSDAPVATAQTPTQAPAPGSTDPALNHGCDEAKCGTDYNPDLAQFQAYLDDLGMFDTRATETNQKGVLSTDTADTAARHKQQVGRRQKTNTHGPSDTCLVLPCLDLGRLRDPAPLTTPRHHEAASTIGQLWRLRKCLPTLALTDLRRLLLKSQWRGAD